ncbi:haloacid dehalogenase [Colletotrichum truncatum]|uniref:Haloacid dehalogenase n=1 Tax=Colletotrichum truncatum TaxID=5467 RepID=A0ACC3Z615_COLTU|nr:haloacid dehalogenase [Colletotrichum truncatum]KAF6787206.1 haloacid dehalogenase [Colletotrichum truncatum]
MASEQKRVVIAFDLYGTLLSTESVASELSKLYGDENANGLAAQWRRYQLEYTWRANSMGIYRSFSELTRASLKHAIAEKKLSLSKEDEDRLMDAYNGLQTFPEINSAMGLVENNASIDAYIFSNGTDDMVGTSMKTSPDLSRMSHVFGPGKLVTVEEVQCFKPSPKTYSHFAEKVGKSGKEDSIWLVSSNPFDALGARAVGWQSAWIDRTGAGWVDSLGSVVGTEPSIVVGGVDEAIRRIMHMSE